MTDDVLPALHDINQNDVCHDKVEKLDNFT